MNTIKLFEEFIKSSKETSEYKTKELDRPSDNEEDIDDDDSKLDGSWIDSNGVVHIKNWNKY